MSNTNTKIWFLLLMAGALFCAGCATETAQQRDQRYKATLDAFCDTARRGVERSSGKMQKDWGPAETATYNSLVLGAVQHWAQAEHPIGNAVDRRPTAYNPVEPPGSSGYGSGVILGPNGKTSTYFRNPGGGVILGNDGSITNVIGN